MGLLSWMKPSQVSGDGSDVMRPSSSSRSGRRQPSGSSKARGAAELPESLRESEEAAAVWAAAKLAGFERQQCIVHGWQILWRPRSTATAARSKVGDMYIHPPRDAFSVGIGSVRSLANLRDALLSRKAAREDPESVMWRPPVRGSLIEVRLRPSESAGLDANGASEEVIWRQAVVHLVDPSRAFQVAVHNERCATGTRSYLRASLPPCWTLDPFVAEPELVLAGGRQTSRAFAGAIAPRRAPNGDASTAVQRKPVAQRPASGDLAVGNAPAAWR